MTTNAAAAPIISDDIARLNERFAIVSLGTYKKTKAVAEFDPDGAVDSVWDFADFRQHLIHEPPIVTLRGLKPLADAWLAHPDARRYRSLVFAPPGSSVVVEADDYNTWHGFAVEPKPGFWATIEFHIRDVICAGKEDHEKWLHNWIAAMVQRPGEHGWCAPLLKGGQGAGKGIFVNEMLGKLEQTSVIAFDFHWLVSVRGDDDMQARLLYLLRNVLAVDQDVRFGN